MQTLEETTEPAAPGWLVRDATAEDAPACGRIFFDAFESIAVRHNLPIEPGSRPFAAAKAAEMLDHPGFAGLVLERDGQILGCAFADERGPIVGIGPVTVAPDAQDGGLGRALMEAIVERQRAREPAGLRLVQTADHYRSLALYAKLGFAIREPLSVLQGAVPRLASSADRDVRPAIASDLAACGELCRQVHGHDRSAELRDAIAAGTARVVERRGAMRGYTTGFGYGWHAVAVGNEDLIALLASAETFLGLGIIVPSRNAELLRWCLDGGLRIVQQSHLMTTGLYSEPAGAYLPSILF